MGDLILLVASAIYFWTLMFEYRPRVSSILAGLLLLGTMGVVMQPHQSEAFALLRDASIAAILLRRVWLLHKDHNHA